MPGATAVLLSEGNQILCHTLRPNLGKAYAQKWAVTGWFWNILSVIGNKRSCFIKLKVQLFIIN